MTITEPTDIWFDYTEPTQFVAQTTQSPGLNSDPQLWLYNETGELLYTNDDYYGLQSYISIELTAGRYRLRAGVCCGRPDFWYSSQDWNSQYELTVSDGSVSTTSLALPPTTTLPQTTTTAEPTTTTTSTTTTTTVEPTTTTTEQPTTTSTQPPEPTVPQTVATTTTTEPATTTTSSSTSTVLTTTSTITVAPSTTTTSPTTTTTTTVPPTTTVAQPTVPAVVSPEQATALATDPEVLSVLSKDEAAEVFDALVVDDLSDTELSALVEAVQDAPVEVREAFEESVNVFGGGLDTYVPIGSTVPVGTRRTLLAINILTTTAPVITRRKW